MEKPLKYIYLFIYLNCYNIEVIRLITMVMTLVVIIMIIKLFLKLLAA